ncbi:MAG: PaRep2b protein, partial [Pyrobaculum sp.]
PGADHLHDFVEELTKGGKLALMLEKKIESTKTESYVFKLFREENNQLKELGAQLRITKMKNNETTVYTLELDARWQEFYKQKFEAAVKKVAEEIERRRPMKDRLLYMGGWINSDVAISKREKRLKMSTSQLWQLAETYALFGWSDVALRGVNLTLDGPKPRFEAYTSLEVLNEAIRRSIEDGWLRMLGTEAGLEDLMNVKSWNDLKQWVAKHWDEVINAVNKRLKNIRVGSGFNLAGALEELEGLKSRLNDDKVARETVMPALLLIQAEKLGLSKETLRYFGTVISGAIDGDGHVSAAMRVVGLSSGNQETTLLWAAALAAHGIKAEVRRATDAFQVLVSGDNAVKLARLYLRSGLPLFEGDDRFKNHKRAEAVELATVLKVSWEGLRPAKSGATADLTIQFGNDAIKYNVYLRKHDILLELESSNPSRVELAVQLLKRAGVKATVAIDEKKNSFRIWATTNRLEAGCEELREALAEIIREALMRGLIGAAKARQWLERLEKDLTPKRSWLNYYMRLAGSGGLNIRYNFTNLYSIMQEIQWLKKMGFEEGRHFTVKMPDKDRQGYIVILKEGLVYAVRLSENKYSGQRRLAAAFVKHILQKAEEAGGDVYEKAKEVVEEGKKRGSQQLEELEEKKVEVNGKTYVVKVTGWGVKIEERQDDTPLLRIRITAEVGGVEHHYIITYGKYGTRNATKAFAYVKTEADAERYSALIKALTGKEPKIYRMKEDKIQIVCGGEHLESFMSYAELADAIEKWLEETSRR